MARAAAAAAVKMRRIPDSLRPRDTSFGPGLLWAIVSLLLGVWMAGYADTIERAAPAAGAASVLLPALYLAGSIRSRRQEARRGRRWDLGTDGNPYPPPLQSMDAEHEAVIFGRDVEIRRIVNRVRFDVSPSRRFVPLEGPSGCGKSSLMRAGVLPELRTGIRRFGLPRARAFDVVGPLSPGPEPFHALLAAVNGVGPTLAAVDEIQVVAASAADAIARDATPALPQSLLASIRDRRGSSDRSVIAIDQIEELVALDPEVRRSFIALLRGLLHHDRDVVVICTLRSDLSGEFLDDIGGELFRDPEKITAMQRSQLRQVVKGPALATGVAIDDELIDRMVDEADGADALPLLSFVLHGLYERSLKDNRISRAEYEAAMGDDNAIARYADDAVEACSQTLQIETRTMVLDVLLEGVAIVRGSVLRRDFDAATLSPIEKAIAEFLQHARILTLDARRFELSHDVLLRRWPALTEAIADRHEMLQARTMLDPRAREWSQEGEPRSLLLSAAELVRLRDVTDQMRGLVGTFVNASVSSDVSELRRRADLVAEQALLALDPPARASDPDLALALVQAAHEELQPTLSTGFALYCCWWYGLRGIVRTRSSSVVAVAWSPDGSDLATVGEDNIVELWRRQDLAVSQLVRHASRISAVAWSPDGSSIATAGFDGVVGLWSRDGASCGELRGHSARVLAVAWSPDGLSVATAGADGLVGLWSRDGALRGELRGHSARVLAVAWSPDGSSLATADGDGSVLLWTPGVAEPRSSVLGSGPVAAASWSPDGAHLAVVGEDHLTEVRASEGAVRQVFAAHTKRVRVLSWSPDGTKLASAGDDCVIKVSTREGNSLATLVGHADSIRILEWSPDGQLLASAGLEPVVRLWSGDPNHQRELVGHRGAVGIVAWSNDSTRLASAGIDQIVRVWSAAGELQHELEGHSETVNAIAWSPVGGALASGGVDRVVRIWSGPFGRARSLRGHEGTIHAIAWSPDGGLVASAGMDRVVRTWSSAGDPLHQFAGHSDRVQALAWSPDGALLASGGDDRTVRLWSATGTDVLVLDGHVGALRTLAWSPLADGLLAAAGADKNILIWSTTGALVTRLQGHSAPVTRLAWSPAGGRLASVGQDQSVRIWSLDGEAVELVGHEGPVNDVAWAPDGSRLATGSHDHTIRVWSKDGAGLHQLVGHTDRVHSVAWSPDGRRLASGSSDATVRLWPDPIGVPSLLDEVQHIAGLPSLTSDDRRKALLPLRDPSS